MQHVLQQQYDVQLPGAAVRCSSIYVAASTGAANTNAAVWRSNMMEQGWTPAFDVACIGAASVDTMQYLCILLMHEHFKKVWAGRYFVHC